MSATVMLGEGSAFKILKAAGEVSAKILVVTP